jgi:hypothetical protein
MTANRLTASHMKYDAAVARSPITRLSQGSGMTLEQWSLTVERSASDNSAMSAHASRLPFSLDALIAEAKRRVRRRRVLVATVLVLLGAVTAAAVIARSPGGPGSGGPSGGPRGPGSAGPTGGQPVGTPFQGLSAAQHPRAKADRLDPSVVAWIAFLNKEKRLHDLHVGLLEPDSSRFVRQLANGERAYAVAATGDAICALVERLRIPHADNLKKPDADWGCSRLTRKVPTTIESFKANPESPVFSWGIALDGVTAVSWSAGKQGIITVPVRHNAWVHLGNASFVHFTAHFADGKTETIP